MRFVQICGSPSLLGMFAIQVIECVMYGRFFIEADSKCPLPVATLTIVMNLMFFGGPLFLFCCFVIGRSSRLNQDDETTNDHEDQHIVANDYENNENDNENDENDNENDENDNENENVNEHELNDEHEPVQQLNINVNISFWTRNVAFCLFFLFFSKAAIKGACFQPKSIINRPKRVKGRLASNRKCR